MDLAEINIKQISVENSPNNDKSVEIICEVVIKDIDDNVTVIDVVFENERLITVSREATTTVSKSVFNKIRESLIIYSNGLIGKSKITLNIKD
jgi:hypothetical protein